MVNFAGDSSGIWVGGGWGSVGSIVTLWFSMLNSYFFATFLFSVDCLFDSEKNNNIALAI